MKKRIRIAGVFLLLSALFFFLSCKKGEKGQTPRSSPGKTQQGAQVPKKKIMYRSTMIPNEISDKPGKDSMGMEMVPFEIEEGGAVSEVGGRVVVKISPERQQAIGVQTGMVMVRPLARIIKSVGLIDYSEPDIVFVNLKFDGWVEKLYVSSTGVTIKKGQPLFDIYSPDLVASQQEYLLAFRAERSFEATQDQSAGRSVMKSAREKLKLWDIPDQEIQELEKTETIRRTLTIVSPRSGFVIEKNVLEGQKVMSGENLYKIADLSKVWFLGEIYEYELPFVRTGDKVAISLSYYPGESFEGAVTFIYPYMNRETRTNKMRVELPNPGFKLKPGMYANLEIHVDFGKKLTIPSDAVLDAGVTKIAFVDKGDGYLEPREIKLGVKGEGLAEVLAGVSGGERVVTSANFLIDSESSLKAALSQMLKSSSEGHGHD